MFEFVCTDNGQGMSEDFQKKHLNHSHRKNQGTHNICRNRAGSCNIKKLTVQMGGTIEFISRQGYGTTFYVKIPFEIDDSYESRQQEIAAEEKLGLTEIKLLLLKIMSLIWKLQDL